MEEVNGSISVLVSQWMFTINGAQPIFLLIRHQHQIFLTNKLFAIKVEMDLQDKQGSGRSKRTKFNPIERNLEMLSGSFEIIDSNCLCVRLVPYSTECWLVPYSTSSCYNVCIQADPAAENKHISYSRGPVLFVSPFEKQIPLKTSAFQRIFDQYAVTTYSQMNDKKKRKYSHFFLLFIISHA